MFNISRISKSPAIFDIDKLTWMNGVYLRNMDLDQYYDLVKPYLEEAIHSKVDLRSVAKILQPRVDTLAQIKESVDFIDELPEYDCTMYIHKKMKTTLEISLRSLNAAREALAALDDWSEEETIHDLLLSLPKQLEMKNGQVLWPVRTAITGKQFTPGGAIEIAHILGKEETLKRIDRGIAKLEEAIKAE